MEEYSGPNHRDSSRNSITWCAEAFDTQEGSRHASLFKAS